MSASDDILDAISKTPDHPGLQGLTQDRWNHALEAAKQTVRSSMAAPTESTIKVFSHFPQWLISILIVALMIVFIACFYLTAQKEVVAVGEHLKNLVSNNTDYLSTDNINYGIFSAFTLGEIGMLVFGILASVLPGDKRTFTFQRKVRTIRPIGLMFRGFSLLCAGFALIANLTIHGKGETDFFSMFINIAPVVITLGIVLAVELLLMAVLKTGVERKTQYEAAMRDFEFAQEHPEKHDKFQAIHNRAIFDEYMSVNKDRLFINNLLALYPEQVDKSTVKRTIVYRERMAYAAWEDNMDVAARPTAPSPSGAGTQTANLQAPSGSLLPPSIPVTLIKG